ncbi:MAG TPA: holo-ACP synthase [Mycobacteriales bacterium]|jgi:holo-[acyl-carrier protein] synthase|nr:holo-ACP synthase [Mycobacteriales bacterium]
MAVVGVGVDVVDVARLARVLDRTPGVAERVFGDAERAYAAAAVAEVRARRLAARFAAKEAAAKALGAPRVVRWREIEVVASDGGRPALRVTGRTAEAAAAAGIRSWHVSLTHDGGVAVAVVVAES